MATIQQIPSPNHFNGRSGQQPRYVILHGTAGGTSAQNIAAWFAQSAAQVSAHYVIGQDGTIVQCVQETDAAWSNGIISGTPGPSGDGIHHDSFWDTGLNPNYLTIAIEHVKPSTDNSDSLTDAQQAASFALIRDICHRWNIPTRYADAQGGITGHFSMDPVNRSRCPGLYPWDALWTYLSSSSSSSAPTQGASMLQLTDPFAVAFFTQDPDGQWRCKPTNQRIRGAILDFYRRSNGILRLPLTEEIRIDPAYSGTVQHFEGGTIAYDPEQRWDKGNGDCYVVHADWSQYSGLVPKTQLDQTQANLQKAQQQIADLQTKLASVPPDLQTKIATLENTLKQIAQLTQSPA